jgi:hypothetical protein
MLIGIFTIVFKIYDYNEHGNPFFEYDKYAKAVAETPLEELIENCSQPIF